MDRSPPRSRPLPPLWGPCTRGRGLAEPDIWKGAGTATLEGLRAAAAWEREGPGRCICQLLFGSMSLPFRAPQNLCFLVWKMEMLIWALPSTQCYPTRLCNLGRAFKILAEIMRTSTAKTALGPPTDPALFNGGHKNRSPLAYCYASSYKCFLQTNPCNCLYNSSGGNYPMIPMRKRAQKG